MKLSQVPARVPLPFANGGAFNTIPTASQIGITAGAASLTDGFPPLTRTPLAAGGVPPSGLDMNGILNLITAVQQWQSSGGLFTYDATFSTSVGGYPKGAILLKASGSGYWISTVDDNATNPDTGGAGWLAFDPWAIQGGGYNSAVDTSATPGAIVAAYNPPILALQDGMQLNVVAANNNSGAATFDPGTGSALPILGMGGTLQGGEIVAGYEYQLVYSSTRTNWTIIGQSGGRLSVYAGSASNHAVNLGQWSNNSGWRETPDGRIEQFGSIQVSNNNTETATGTVTFPTAFPTQLDNIQLTGNLSSMIVALTGTPSLSSFQVNSTNRTTGTAVTVTNTIYWKAWGK